MTAVQRRATDRFTVLSATAFLALILCSVWIAGPSRWELGLLACALMAWALLLGICLHAYHRPIERRQAQGRERPRWVRDARLPLAGAAILSTAAFAIVSALTGPAPPGPTFGVSAWVDTALLAVAVGAFIASLRSSRLRWVLRAFGAVCAAVGLGHLSFTLAFKAQIRYIDQRIVQREAEVTVVHDLTPLLTGLEVEHLGDVEGFESARWQAPCPAVSDLEAKASGSLVGLLVVGHADQWRLRGAAADGARSNRDLARRRAQWVAGCLRGFSGPVVPLAAGPVNLGAGLADGQYAEDRIVEIFGLVTHPGDRREETIPVRFKPFPTLGAGAGSITVAGPAAPRKPTLEASLP